MATKELTYECVFTAGLFVARGQAGVGTLGDLAAFVGSVLSGSPDPLAASARVFASYPGVRRIICVWGFTSGHELTAHIDRAAGHRGRLSKFIAGPCEIDQDVGTLETDHIVYGLTATVATYCKYGPRQLVEWASACLPGPTCAQARAERDRVAKMEQFRDVLTADRWDSLMAADGTTEEGE